MLHTTLLVKWGLHAVLIATLLVKWGLHAVLTAFDEVRAMSGQMIPAELEVTL